MTINVQINWKSNNITTQVISYTREQKICSGIGELNVILEGVTSTDFVVWDRIVLWEEGRKKGTYFISTITRNTKGEVVLACQDKSKRLVDYFITDQHYIDYPSYAGYWIGRFCDEAGVDYTFETDPNGQLVSENTTLGPGTAYELIQTLIQQCGWYMYFDADGHCHIGDLGHDDTTTRRRINDTFILSVETNRDDKMLRNRAVVWGGGDGTEQVFADITRPSPYLTHSKDVRTVVVANGNIRGSSTAYALANTILDEFNRLTFTKTFELEGERNIQIGDLVKSSSSYWSGEGFVTTVGSYLNASRGLVTKIVLDERCPRLFGFYSYESYVYIATYGAGVWRKVIGEDTWEAFSTGLNHFNVTDLIIKSGTFACVADGIAYISIGENVADWNAFIPPLLEDLNDIAYLNIYVDCVACAIDDTTGNIFFAYRLKPEVELDQGYQRSWVVEITPEGGYVAQSQIYYQDDTMQDFKVIDVTRHGENSNPTAEAPASYAPPTALFGYRRVYPEGIPSLNSYTYTPLGRDASYEDAFVPALYEIAYYGDVDIEGNSIVSHTANGYQYPNDNKISYAAFDKDDNRYYATKLFTQTEWPVHYYYTDENNYYYTNHKFLFRDATSEESGEEVTGTRYYNVVDIGVLVAGGSTSLYLNTVQISPLLSERPVYHDEVRMATTGNIDLFGNQVIDGITATTGRRVLVKDQNDPSENGIYIANGGDWYRASDMIYAAQFVRGAFVTVREGTINDNKAFQLDIDEGEAVSLGFTPITWTEVFQVTGSSSYLVADDSIFTGNAIQVGDIIVTSGTIYLWFWGYGDGASSPNPGTLPPAEEIQHQVHWIAVGTNTGVELVRIEKVKSTSEHNYGNYKMMACGNGVALVRGRADIGDASSANNIDIFRLVGTELEQDSVGIGVGSASGLGDWEQPPINPVHGAAASVPEIVYVGAIIDAGVTSFIKYKATTGSHGMWTCCFTRECAEEGSPRKVVNDADYNFYSGIINVLTGEKVNPYAESNLTRKTGNCDSSTEVNVDPEKEGFNLGQVYPTSTRSANPLYVYGGQIWDILTDSPVGTIPVAGDICPQLDDFDNCLIIVDEPTVYKVSPGGTVIAEIRSVGLLWGPPNCSNSFVFSYNASYKFGHDTLFQGVDFCYLLDDIQTGFDIVDLDFYDLYTETNKDGPIVAFTQPPVLFTYVVDGVTYYGNSPERLKSYNNYYGELVFRGEFNDVRTFDLAGNLTDELGAVLDTPRGKYIGATDRTNYIYKLVRNAAGSAWQTILTATPPETPSKIETANYSYPPYMFISTSGGGSGPTFLERSPGVSAFTDHSSTLPAQDITSIRLDDRM